MKREFKEILLKIFIKDVEELKRKNKLTTERYNARRKKQKEYFAEKRKKIKEETAIKLAINNKEIAKRNREIKANNEIIKKELINLKTEAKKGIVSIKTGIRRPSISKSIKARTTAKAKRKLNSTINPLYGQKGMGWVNNPKRALYNKR